MIDLPPWFPYLWIALGIPLGIWFDYRAARAGLVERCEQEHAWLLEGDMRGITGCFPPVMGPFYVEPAAKPPLTQAEELKTSGQCVDEIQKVFEQVCGPCDHKEQQERSARQLAALAAVPPAMIGRPDFSHYQSPDIYTKPPVVTEPQLVKQHRAHFAAIADFGGPANTLST